IRKQINDHLTLHGCVSRFQLKMVAESTDGTRLTPFLNEFAKSPRQVPIIECTEDLLSSDLISIAELIIYSKSDIIVRKSSLLKHFEQVMFFRKRDADILSESTLVIN
ncbi:unnamed protein product, partial [Didymodactylos carnosus]